MKKVVLLPLFALIPAGFFFMLWLFGWNTGLLAVITAVTGLLSLIARLFDGDRPDDGPYDGPYD